MKVDKTKAGYGALWLLSLILTFTGGRMLTTEEYEVTYFCEATEQLAFESEIGSIECSSEWVKFSEFVKEHDFEKEKIVYIEVEKKLTYGQEVCDQSGCKPKVN